MCNFNFERFWLGKRFYFDAYLNRKNWRLKPLTLLRPQINEIHKNDSYIFTNLYEF